MYLVHVSLHLIGQQGLGRTVGMGIGPCFPLAGGLCKLKFYANVGGNRSVQSLRLLVQYAIQAASQSTFFNTQLYSTGVTGNDKNDIIETT